MKHIALALALLTLASTQALANGEDMSFYLVDDITGKSHSITEHSIKLCRELPHYSVVTINGIPRRCVQNIKWGVTTK